MRRRCVIVALFVFAVLLLPKGDVEACGPFFEPDVFVRGASADDRAGFAKGQLGILTGFDDSSNLAIAYRYLNGGELSDDERFAYAPQSASQTEPAANDQTKGDVKPSDAWLAERMKFGPFDDAVRQELKESGDPQGNIVLGSGYLNCPGTAFKTASLTLTKRTQQWGSESKWLLDWIHGQDAVLSNCIGYALTPNPAPADAPELLKADRAYQIASAAFYASKFDEAVQQFAVIAADHDSPWREWGTYLQARALVRKAFENGKTTDPFSGDLATFDLDTMRRAQQLLETALAQPNPTPSRQIIQCELNFILIRTDPQRRAAELSAAIAGPAPDANFDNDLKDLNFLIVKHIDVKGPAPLLDWIKAWRGGSKPADAYASWQQSHALPWLVMAIALARPQDPFAPALIEDANRIAPRNAAYDTVFYHRIRLLTALHRGDEARSLLDAALPALRRRKPNSNLNALLGERMQVSRNFSEFLEFAPRTILSAESQGNWALRDKCNQKSKGNPDAMCRGIDVPVGFDGDASQILNRKTPLPLLIEAAKSTTLPRNLRESVAIMTWTRSVLLQDPQSAAALAPILPKPIRDTAGDSVGFPADLAILRNPGIRPYIEAGVPRVSSYDNFDAYRNNWWCTDWSEEQGYGVPRPDTVPNPSFLTANQIALANSQLSVLQKLPDSAIVVGQRVLDYAKAHPDDPQVPEALALTVRATHYACQTYNANSSGGTGSEYTPTSKAAFELLHKRYPKSQWTAKTRYYY